MPIAEYELPKRLDVDIEIDDPTRLPGCVSEYECREAAVFVCVSWREWLEMDSWGRACAVAHYRTNLLIKSHVDDASSSMAERMARRNRDQR